MFCVRLLSIAILALWSPQVVLAQAHTTFRPDMADLPAPLPLSPDEPIWNVVFDEDVFAKDHSDSRRPPVRLVQSFAVPLANAAAWGRYWETYNETGWSVLDLHTSPALDTNQQSFAAGYLEGALTSHRMTEYLTNVWGIDFDWPEQVGGGAGDVVGSGLTPPNINTKFRLPEDVKAWLRQNLNWMTENAEKNGKTDPYWELAGGLVSQMFGLTAGYNAAAEKKLGELEILAMSLIDTDMEDIMKAVSLRQKVGRKRRQGREGGVGVRM